MNVITASNLKTPRPSEEWMQQLRASLLAFAGSSTPLSDCFADENWPGRNAAHCLYSVDWQTVMGLKALDSITTPWGWRFIASDPQLTGPAVACWCLNEGSPLGPKVISALQSPELTEIMTSAELLNGLKEVNLDGIQPYELRVIRIPAFHLEAFWLKTPGGLGDFVVPYGLILNSAGAINLGPGKTLQKNQVYAASEFLNIVTDAAKQRLERSRKAIAAHKSRPGKRVPSSLRPQV
jgi:hypothetical protein